MSTWFNILSRRKPIPSSNYDKNGTETQQDSNQLARVLTTLDLTALGVGSTLGVGVYVLAGHVAKETAGPAVVLSFLIAAIASVFAGLCYAEFGARVPRAGSAYVYSYVCVGEFIAFIIGWNLILEYVIGSASVAKGLSVYLDTLLNNTMKNAFIDIAPIESSFLSDYFDFFSLTITLVLGAALAFGLKESSLANNIFTFINILVVVFVVIAGGIKADPKNWSIKNDTIPPEYNGGNGGFFPFGIEGVIKGAATCFYGFVGFDCIATTGEEVKNPQKAIPISIILSLFIIFLSYFGTSAVVTLMLPYYLQDPDAPIPHAFAEIGWEWAKWIVSIGGIFGLCASLFGAMFPLPRIIYAMANDALVFRFLGTVNSRFRTPVVGTLLAAVLTGLMSALFNLKQLVNMMSIGTLMAYTIVAACVIILRCSVNEEETAEWKYSLLQPEVVSDDEYSDVGHTYEPIEDYTENLNLIPPKQDVTMGTIMKSMFNFSKRNPTYITQKLVTTLVFVFCVLCFILACLVSFLKDDLENGELNVIIPIGITVFLMLAVLLSMYAQPTVNATLSFKVPLVPLIPALSICINIYLMMMLDGNTWIRFGIWMAIGLPIYFISCKLYLSEKTNQNTNSTKQNGIKKNGHVLTIPEIVVDPPSIGNYKMEDSIVESEKEEHNITDRRQSINSDDVENAVLELDKVLDLEPEYIDNLEAVNPENDYKNSTILTKSLDNTSITSVQSNHNAPLDNQSICSSDSDSVHSKEHHIEVLIHQEDNTDNTSEIFSEPVDDNVHTTITKSTTNFNEDMDNINADNNDQNMDQMIDPTIVQIMDEIIDNVDKNIYANKVETIYTIHPPANYIPPPPPLQNLLDEITNNVTKLPPLPSKIKRPPLFTTQEIGQVELRPTTQRLKQRTVSTTSEGPLDNVKHGSDQYNKIKSKLDIIFTNRVPLPDTRFIIDDKNPSSSVDKEIEILEKKIEEYENELPDDFAKSKEFRNALNDILFKRHSINQNEKPEIHLNENIKENNHKTSLSNDEIQHKKLMANSLQTIRLRKTGLITNDSEETDDNNEDNEKNEGEKKESTKNSVEKDKEKHKRLMIGTLRSIKLRKTGLALSEDTNDIKSSEDVDR